MSHIKYYFGIIQGRYGSNWFQIESLKNLSPLHVCIHILQAGRNDEGQSVHHQQGFTGRGEDGLGVRSYSGFLPCCPEHEGMIEERGHKEMFTTQFATSKTVWISGFLDIH
jgi:hypothetical protein